MTEINQQEIQDMARTMYALEITINHEPTRDNLFLMEQPIRVQNEWLKSAESVIRLTRILGKE